MIKNQKIISSLEVIWTLFFGRGPDFFCSKLCLWASPCCVYMPIVNSHCCVVSSSVNTLHFMGPFYLLMVVCVVAKSGWLKTLWYEKIILKNSNMCLLCKYAGISGWYVPRNTPWGPVIALLETHPVKMPSNFRYWKLFSEVELFGTLTGGIMRIPVVTSLPPNTLEKAKLYNLFYKWGWSTKTGRKWVPLPLKREEFLKEF